MDYLNEGEERVVRKSLKRRKTCKFSVDGQHDFVETVPECLRKFYPTVEEWVSYQFRERNQLRSIFNHISHFYQCSKCGKQKYKYEKRV